MQVGKYREGQNNSNGEEAVWQCGTAPDAVFPMLPRDRPPRPLIGCFGACMSFRRGHRDGQLARAGYDLLRL